MGMKATRHNGRSGSHGSYDVKHNDRDFDSTNADHIDEERSLQNVYWDCYQGYSQKGSEEEKRYTFSEVEKSYYLEHYGDHVFAQNLRNEAARHKERNREIDDVLKNKKTCPEESLFQLGNIDGTVKPAVLAQVSAEYFEKFEERFGSHVHILDWALHLDETTPHIHERHVFDARNEYGELCPMQDKALEELGFDLPDPTKEKGRFNNRKMSFDAECRKMFLEICKEHGLEIDMEPVYGGKSYLEKADYIVQKLRDENAKLTKENAELKTENSELVLKISDVEKFIDDVSNDAFEKAIDVLPGSVIDETHKETIKLIDDFEERIHNSKNSPTVKSIAQKIIAEIKGLLMRVKEKMLASIKRKLSDPEIREKNVTEIKEKVCDSVLAKLAKAKEEVNRYPSSGDKPHIRKEAERS